MAVLRSSLHQYFHAECARCGFAVDGEIKNGMGGWKDYSWDEFSKQCNYKTPAGRPTLTCPHLRAAKVNCQPVSVCGDAPCAGTQPPQIHVLASKAAQDESRRTAEAAQPVAA